MSRKAHHPSKLWLVLVACLGVIAAPALADGVSDEALEKASNGPNEIVDLIVTYRSAPDCNGVSAVRGNGGQVRHKFEPIDGLGRPREEPRYLWYGCDADD